MGTVRQLLIVLSVAFVSTVAVGAAWVAIGGGDLPIHGWIALSLGTAGTVAMTWVLMRLAFRSDREGWDARADDTSDLRRKSPEA
ncbi:hypothetical protein [Brevundimonas sp.]|uniref:hypothetical protein n=1 Tax=Brevundimonas sp. TaxID=1871086 RepID=UPI0035B2E837